MFLFLCIDTEISSLSHSQQDIASVGCHAHNVPSVEQSGWMSELQIKETLLHYLWKFDNLLE